ncbi:MAG: PfkB family carbohydrate kinase, partial [Ilumatobacteraceae bacterium]
GFERSNDALITSASPYFRLSVAFADVDGDNRIDMVWTGGAYEPLGIGRPGAPAALDPSVTAAIEPVLHLDVPVFVDVNCRPAMIDDRPAYLERVHRVASLADVVKVSDEDARWMSGEAGERGVELAVESLLTLGARAVVVTAGASPVSVSTPTGRAEVPVPAVDIVDTIGAGDAFDAGMIAHWFRAGADARGLGDLDALLPAVRAGVVVSGAVCARRGADPPTVAELPDDLWP